MQSAHDDATGDEVVRQPSRPGVVLATVCVSLTAITINTSLLNVGLPTLARQLGASNTGLEWIVDGYALVFAGFLLAAGSLGDRIGRRQVMMTGLAVFGTCSALAGAAHSTGELIAARCGMGLGAACVMPMTLSVLTDVYRTEAGLRRAIGVWAATASAGAVVAPLLAGVLLNSYWWGSLFLVNVPIAAVMLVAVALTIPDSAPRGNVSIDWGGVGLSIVFAAALVFALIEGPSLGWHSPLVVGGLVVAAVALGLFRQWERRAAQPLIDIRCFRIPRFSVGCGVVAMQYFFSFGTSFMVTQYLQLVLGYSALATGVALMPSAAILMVVAPYGARAFGRYGARAVTTISLLIAAAGAASMNLAGAGSSLAPILIALMLVNVAIGLMAPGTTSMVMSALPPEQAGMASGTQSTTRQLGGALGVAVLGSLLAARYTAALTHTLPGTPAARYLPTAKRSLASALHATPNGDPVHGLLTQLSRAAFVDGLHVAASVTAGAAAACAAVVFWVLRAVPATATPAGEGLSSVTDLTVTPAPEES
jgi:EmrB/QacA subfamily drug resistance transporter